MAGPLLTHPDAGLTLVTLGAAELRASARDASSRDVLLGAGKPLALLTYLALAPGRSASREQMLDLLWADVEREAGRHSLRQAIWYLKRRVGHDLVVASGDVLELGRSIGSDHQRFLRAVEIRNLADVVGTYFGEFLPGFAVPAGVQFELRAEVERQRLRSMFVRAADTVVRSWLGAARTREAVALARRVREQDPLNEEVWRLVIEALISVDDRLGAIAGADALERLLAADEREAEPATRAMFRAARQSSAATPQPVEVGLVAELVGREADFAVLLAAWDQARNGATRYIHIAAPAGLGKSRLLADFHARLRGMRPRRRRPCPSREPRGTLCVAQRDTKSPHDRVQFFIEEGDSGQRDFLAKAERVLGWRPILLPRRDENGEGYTPLLAADLVA